MAVLTGDMGPNSGDANQVQLSAGCWRYRRTLAATDTLTLQWLGRGAPTNPISIVGTGQGIIETIHLQKANTADVVPCSMKNYPASLGVTGAPIGGSVAGEAGARVGAGQIWQSSVGGSLIPCEELFIDNTLGAGAVDVTVIVREDL